MARRAAILRAFAYPADLVLLDEPFHNLDVALKYKIMDELSALLRENESTAVLVTHTAEEALYLADEIAVMGRRQNRRAFSERRPGGRAAFVDSQRGARVKCRRDGKAVPFFSFRRKIVPNRLQNFRSFGMI